MKTKGEDIYLQAQEKYLEQSCSSEETNLVDTLILNSQPPELYENKFQLFKLPGLRFFMMAALADSHRPDAQLFPGLGTSKILLFHFSSIGPECLSAVS